MMRFFFLKKMGEMHFCYKKRVYLFCANNYYFLKEDKKRMTTYFDAQADYYYWF